MSVSKKGTVATMSGTCAELAALLGLTGGDHAVVEEALADLVEDPGDVGRRRRAVGAGLGDDRPASVRRRWADAGGVAVDGSRRAAPC